MNTRNQTLPLNEIADEIECLCAEVDGNVCLDAKQTLRMLAQHIRRHANTNVLTALGAKIVMK